MTAAVPTGPDNSSLQVVCVCVFLLICPVVWRSALDFLSDAVNENDQSWTLVQ